MCSPSGTSNRKLVVGVISIPYDEANGVEHNASEAVALVRARSAAGCTAAGVA